MWSTRLIKINKYFLNEDIDRLVLFQIPETLNFCEMGEGHIGKIQVRKSGKIDFYVNDGKYLNISQSVCGTFLQVENTYIILLNKYIPIFVMIHNF